MSLHFRNIDASPSEPVEHWGVEGILAAIDRGGLQHWRRIGDAVRAEPFGKVASELEDALRVAEDVGIVALMTRALQDAREDDKVLYGRTFRRLVDESDLTHAEIAELLGTSRSRVSSYCSGAVTPNAAAAEKLRRYVVHRRSMLL